MKVHRTHFWLCSGLADNAGRERSAPISRSNDLPRGLTDYTPAGPLLVLTENTNDTQREGCIFCVAHY